MYKIFKVRDEAKGKDGFQIFWCPSAPLYFTDKIAYSDKIYPQRQGAHRKLQKLEEAREDAQPHKAAERQEP